MVVRKLLSLMAEISTKFWSYSLDLQLFCGVETSAPIDGCLVSLQWNIYARQTDDVPVSQMSS